MKRYNWIYCLIGVTFILSVTPSYSKTHTYTWAKGNIEISANGVLEQPGTNDAQSNILVKEATRSAGYRTIVKFLSALPLDSTRNIGALEKSNAEFAHQLNQWIIMNSSLTHFQFTSESTGSVRISINARQFAKFVSQYDKPVIVKTKTAPVKTAKTLASDTSKMKKTIATDTTNPSKTLVADTTKVEKTIALDTSKSPKTLAVDTPKIEKVITLDTSIPPKTLVTDTSIKEMNRAVDTSKTITITSADTAKPEKNLAIDSSKTIKTVPAGITTPKKPILQPSPMDPGLPMGDRRRMPPAPSRVIQAEVQMNVAKDTSIPENVRISQAETGVRAKEKQELYRQIADTQVSGIITYTQWVHTHPTYEDSLKMAIDNNIILGIPQWNADSTQVKINGRVDVRFLLNAVRQAEMKIQNAPMSRDTTKVMSPTSPPPTVKH